MKSLLVRIERYNNGKGKLSDVWDLAKEYEKRIKLLEKAKSIYESYYASIYFTRKNEKELNEIDTELIKE